MEEEKEPFRARSEPAELPIIHDHHRGKILGIEQRRASEHGLFDQLEFH